MNVALRAAIGPLIENQPWTYLAENYASGVTAVTVENGSLFATDDFVIIGEVANEFTEERKVLSVAGNVVTFTAATSFPHRESSRVTACPYDQVRFYRTTTTTFDTLGPLTGQLPLTPYFPYVQFDDAVNQTGYGWFVFSNSVTGASTVNSSPIPYANFARNTLKNAIDGFYSLLNSNEQKLVTHDEVVEWLCEAYDEAKNDLAMNVDQWDATDGTDYFDVLAGVAEYDLPEDFGEMLTVRSSVDFGWPMQPLSIQNVDYANWLGFNTWYLPAGGWYIRGTKLGFAPTPTSPFTAYYRYKRMASRLVNYYDVIDLPKKAFNSLKDFALYRAGIKLKRSDYMEYYKAFKTQMADLRLRANNTDNSIDSQRFYPSSRI